MNRGRERRIVYFAHMALVEKYFKKGEGPRHPLPITGFTSFCNLIAKNNITDINKKINQKKTCHRL